MFVIHGCLGIYVANVCFVSSSYIFGVGLAECGLTRAAMISQHRALRLLDLELKFIQMCLEAARGEEDKARRDILLSGKA